MILPHSCGDHCEEKRNQHCTHEPCPILCHPGACPPCNILVEVTCHCGKKSQSVPCQIAKRSKFSCKDECGKLLNCGNHDCEEECHDGPCTPCGESEDLP